MKTAIFIDSLISRDDAVAMMELILNIFPNSEIYTIAHKQGGILGQIETRPIVSSYLSHKARSDKNVLAKNFWILPTAVGGIPLHASIEKAIFISRGYVHGVKLPPHVKRYLYILDWDLVDQGALSWWQKLFIPYVNDWREKALIQFPKIAVSSEHLKERLHLPNAEVIQATFRTEEYPFVKDEDHNFEFHHHLLYTHGLSRNEFSSIAKFLLDKKQTVRVMGPDEEFRTLLGANPNLDFVGDHCESTGALYSHQAKAVWDFSRSFFPARAFGAFCTGRPVVVRDLPVNREYLGEDAHYLKDASDLERIFSAVESSYLGVDRRALRRKGLKWNERLFKSRMVKFLERHPD